MRTYRAARPYDSHGDPATTGLGGDGAKRAHSQVFQSAEGVRMARELGKISGLRRLFSWLACLGNRRYRSVSVSIWIAPFRPSPSAWSQAPDRLSEAVLGDGRVSPRRLDERLSRDDFANVGDELDQNRGLCIRQWDAPASEK